MYTRVPPVKESIRASRPAVRPSVHRSMPSTSASNCCEKAFWLIWARHLPPAGRPQANIKSAKEGGAMDVNVPSAPQAAKARASDVTRRVKSLKGGSAHGAGRARAGTRRLKPRGDADAACAARPRFYDTGAGVLPRRSGSLAARVSCGRFPLVLFLAAEWRACHAKECVVCQIIYGMGWPGTGTAYGADGTVV